MSSIWIKDIERPDFKTLRQDLKTQVLIVGGGMAGILCAYMLSKPGIDYVLLEADRICSGITKNTTAKITLQHGLIYDKLYQSYGKEKATLYLNAMNSALYEYKKLCKTIDCDFKECDSFVYSLNNPKNIENEIDTLCKIGYFAEFTKHISLPFSVTGAVKISNQAQFHPLKYNPYEHSWDCSCHGSRFTQDGKLIDNPATDDMRR